MAEGAPQPGNENKLEPYQLGEVDRLDPSTAAKAEAAFGSESGNKTTSSPTPDQPGIKVTPEDMEGIRARVDEKTGYNPDQPHIDIDETGQLDVAGAMEGERPLDVAGAMDADQPLDVAGEMAKDKPLDVAGAMSDDDKRAAQKARTMLELGVHGRSLGAEGDMRDKSDELIRQGVEGLNEAERGQQPPQPPTGEAQE